MFCSACGSQIPDEALFCAACGQPMPRTGAPVPAAATPVPPPPPYTPPTAAPPAAAPRAAATPVPPPAPAPVPPTPTGYAGYGAPPAPPGHTGYGVPPTGPGKGSRTGLWIGITAAAVIIIAAAVAVPLLLRDGDDTPSVTTVASSTTSTTGSSTTETAATTTSEATTTTTLAAGAPGDSAGEWVELGVPGVDGEVWTVCVSDEALLIKSMANDVPALHAYMLDSGELIQLPTEASQFYGEDLDGLLAVWWEGDYDEVTYEYRNEHVYSYLLPNGPKIEVATGSSISYPQVAGSWITWTEEEPWAENPEEYSLLRVLGVEVDSGGVPTGEPVELVSSATRYNLGDSFWTYSLSDTHLTWENATAVDIYEPGIYTMDLEARQPLIVGNQAWRPSVGSDTLVYYEDGLKAMNLATRETREIDLLGDFATAAPTFATYFRAVESPDDYSYEIVARGYDGEYEQVLGNQSEPPWLSPFIAASDTHVAFAAGGVLHLFEWQAE